MIVMAWDCVCIFGGFVHVCVDMCNVLVLHTLCLLQTHIILLVPLGAIL